MVWQVGADVIDQALPSPTVCARRSELGSAVPYHRNGNRNTNRNTDTNTSTNTYTNKKANANTNTNKNANKNKNKNKNKNTNTNTNMYPNTNKSGRPLLHRVCTTVRIRLLLRITLLCFFHFDVDDIGEMIRNCDSGAI